jgi:choline dehydrogenase
MGKERFGVNFVDGPSLYKADPRSTAETRKGGKEGRAPAKQEVIISASAFNTPQNLELSGTGPWEELKKRSVPVVQDLPGVGTNLQGHYETSTIITSN